MVKARTRVRHGMRITRVTLSAERTSIGIIADSIEDCQYKSNSLKDYRIRLKAIVNNDKIWTGLEELKQVVKSLKGRI